MVHKVLQVSNGRVVDAKGVSLESFDLPTSAAWTLSSAGIKEFTEDLERQSWPEAFLGGNASCMASSVGSLITARPFRAEPGQLISPSPLSLLTSHTPANLSEHESLGRFLSSLSTLSSKMDSAKSELSASTLTKQSHAVGFRNCLRPTHLRQLTLLCTAAEDLNSSSFFLAVKTLVTRRYSELPCFATPEKARALVNVAFDRVESKTTLLPDDLFEGTITDVYHLVKVLQHLGILSEVLHNLPVSYFTEMNIAPPIESDRAFLADILKPWIEALTVCPIILETTVGFAISKMTLSTAGFSFQYDIVKELLTAISSVINSSAGEFMGWSRATLISKLRDVSVLPTNWRELYDNHRPARTDRQARPTMPQQAKPVAESNPKHPKKAVRGNKPSVPDTPAKVVKAVDSSNKVQAITAVAAVSAKSNFLCFRQVCFKVGVEPDKCAEKDCPYSHSSPTKDQLIHFLKLDRVSRDKPLVAAVKAKFKFDSM